MISRLSLRSLWVVVGLVVATLILSACGGGEEETPTPLPSPIATSPLPTPTPTTAVTPTSGPTPTSTQRPTPTSTPRPSPTPVPTPFALEPYHSRAHGLSLSIPRGWVADDTDPEMLVVAHPTGLASVAISVDTFLGPPDRTQFGEFVSLLLLGLDDEFEDFEEISREWLESPPGLLIEFTFTRNGQGQGAMALYTFNNIQTARALATTTADFYDLFSKLFEETITSLELEPEPPGPTPTPGPSPTPAPTPTPVPTVVPTFTPGIYSDPDLGFTLTVPSGWGMLSPSKAAAVRFMGPARFIVQVLTAEIPAEMTPTVYALVLEENRYEPLPSYTFLSQGDTEVAGLSAREVQFLAATGPDESINRHLVFVTRVGTQAYVIEALGPASEFDATVGELRDFMGSFEP